MQCISDPHACVYMICLQCDLSSSFVYLYGLPILRYNPVFKKNLKIQFNPRLYYSKENSVSIMNCSRVYAKWKPVPTRERSFTLLGNNNDDTQQISPYKHCHHFLSFMPKITQDLQ